MFHKWRQWKCTYKKRRPFERTINLIAVKEKAFLYCQKFICKLQKETDKTLFCITALMCSKNLSRFLLVYNSKRKKLLGPQLQPDLNNTRNQRHSIPITHPPFPAFPCILWEVRGAGRAWPLNWLCWMVWGSPQPGTPTAPGTASSAHWASAEARSISAAVLKGCDGLQLTAWHNTAHQHLGPVSMERQWQK